MSDSILDGLKGIVGGPKLHGLQHAGVTVRNFEKAIKWYNFMFDWYLVNELYLEPKQVKRLSKLYGDTEMGARLGFLATQSGALLEIFEFTPTADAERVVWNRPGYTHIAISVTNVPKVKAELEDKGAEFLTDVVEFGGAHWAFMQDPDGNLIELIDFHANRLPLLCAGRLVGKIFKKMQFGKYYQD